MCVCVRAATLKWKSEDNRGSRFSASTLWVPENQLQGTGMVSDQSFYS